MRLGFGFRRYRLAFRMPVRTAHGLWTEREGLLVRLQDERGRTGWGEAAPIPWFGTEDINQAEAAARALAPIMEISDRGEWRQQVPATPCLAGALVAAWDDLCAGIFAAEQELPEGRIVSSPFATAGAAEFLTVAALLPAGRAALIELPRKAEVGFRVFKWKVGVAPVGDELALLDDVCAALPEGAKLRLDANGAWDRRQAEQWLERCAERPIEFVEQPCHASAAEGGRRQRQTEDMLCGLAEDYPTPIALDESLAGDGDIETWLGRGWRGVYVVKPLLLADAQAAVVRLAAARAQVVFSSALETAVGARLGLQLAFAWTGERRALGYGVWPLFADARFDGPVAAPFVWRRDIASVECARLWTALEEGAS